MFISFLINKVGREAFHRLIRDHTHYWDLAGMSYFHEPYSLNSLTKE